MALFSERKRDEEIARREAAGENLWTEDISQTARVRLIHIAEFFSEEMRRNYHHLGPEVAAVLRSRIGYLTSEQIATSLNRDGSIPPLNWLGAAYEVIGRRAGEGSADGFAVLVNEVFRHERIAYKFVDGVIVEFSSDELNTAVVEPAVRLLVGKQFDAAHGAYMNALKEIANGEPGDAITDAGSALQETLKALGCDGNSLGRQLADAKKKGLLAGHDQSLTDSIAKFIDWASADRSESGDAHKHPDAGTADAWLMVHIVGALIVRLVDPAKRGQATE